MGWAGDDAVAGSSGNESCFAISEDMGATWLPMGSGMPMVPVHDIDFHQLRVMIAGTHGRSLYRTSIPCPDVTDTDGDGIMDACDNCPLTYNPNQEDLNHRGPGTLCEYNTCGDIDGTEGINILDIVFMINYKYKGGPAPSSLESADVNSDLYINILDIVYLINSIYKNGPAPNCPV